MLVTTVYMHVLIGIKDIVNKYFCKKNDRHLITVVNRTVLVLSEIARNKLSLPLLQNVNKNI